MRKVDDRHYLKFTCSGDTSRSLRSFRIEFYAIVPNTCTPSSIKDIHLLKYSLDGSEYEDSNGIRKITWGK